MADIEKHDVTEKWLYENARKLEIAKWDYLFNDGKKDDILKGLLKYQNADGGFGNCLEPDIRTPESSAIASVEAIFTLLEYEFELKGNWFDNLLQYFENSCKNYPSYYDKVPESINNSPHAPWWNYEVPKEFSPNPAAVISALLIRYGNSKQKKIGIKISADVFSFILNDKSNFSHDTFCLQAFYEILKDHPSMSDEIINQLKNRITSSVNLDITQWEGYVARPFDFIFIPNSLWHNTLKEHLSINAEYIKNKLSETGYLKPPFSWGTTSEASTQATLEWIGYITVKNEKILKKIQDLF